MYYTDSAGVRFIKRTWWRRMHAAKPNDVIETPLGLLLAVPVRIHCGCPQCALYGLMMCSGPRGVLCCHRNIEGCDIIMFKHAEQIVEEL